MKPAYVTGGENHAALTQEESRNRWPELVAYENNFFLLGRRAVALSQKNRDSVESFTFFLSPHPPFSSGALFSSRALVRFRVMALDMSESECVLKVSLKSSAGALSRAAECI